MGVNEPEDSSGYKGLNRRLQRAEYTDTWGQIYRVMAKCSHFLLCGLEQVT